MSILLEERDELRRSSLRKRDALSSESRRASSNRIAEIVKQILGDHVRMIHAYLNHRSEVETRQLIATLVSSGCQVLVPVVNPAEDGTHILEHWRITDVEDVVPGQYKIDEPRSREVGDPTSVNSILVPLVAFDRSGTRLGYGKGYYDRFLREFPDPIRIGLAFECQEVSRIPKKRHDEPLDFIVTEKEVIATGARALPTE